MWWPESSLILLLNKSKHYQRLLVCIYVSTLWVLATSSWWMGWKVMAGSYLAIHGVWIIREGVPTSKPILLVYAAHQWTLRVLPSGELVELADVTLLLNTGLFLLLRINTVEQASQIKVVFKDQLSEEALRRLMWLLV